MASFFLVINRWRCRHYNDFPLPFRLRSFVLATEICHSIAIKQEAAIRSSYCQHSFSKFTFLQRLISLCENIILDLPVKFSQRKFKVLCCLQFLLYNDLKLSFRHERNFGVNRAKTLGAVFFFFEFSFFLA